MLERTARNNIFCQEVGATCHKMYETATGLAPEIAHFNMDVNKNDDVIIKVSGYEDEGDFK